MGIKLEREKKRSLIASFIYLMYRIPFPGKKAKMKLLLDLEFMFDRLSHEQSFRVIPEDEHPARISIRNFLKQRLNDTHSVLDLGCGVGTLGYYASQYAGKVVGVDFNKDHIEHANRTYKKENLQYICGEVREYLTSNPQKFHVLMLAHILEHLDDPKGFILAYKDHFENVFIEVPDFDKTYLNHYRKRFNSRLIYTDADHVSEFDRYELADLLKECGLEIQFAEYIYGIQRLWCKVS